MRVLTIPLVTITRVAEHTQEGQRGLGRGGCSGRRRIPSRPLRQPAGTGRVHAGVCRFAVRHRRGGGQGEDGCNVALTSRSGSLAAVRMWLMCGMVIKSKRIGLESLTDESASVWLVGPSLSCSNERTRLECERKTRIVRRAGFLCR